MEHQTATHRQSAVFSGAFQPEASRAAVAIHFAGDGMEMPEEKADRMGLETGIRKETTTDVQIDSC